MEDISGNFGDNQDSLEDVEGLYVTFWGTSKGHSGTIEGQTSDGLSGIFVAFQGPLGVI